MGISRIEEMVEEFIIEFSHHITANTPWGVQQIEDQMRECLTEALTQAHQAGIDEVVELLKEKRNGQCGKKGCLQAYCINRKIIRRFCDDTIKSLQNNK